MPVEGSLRLRLLSATLLAGTGFAVLDVSIHVFAGSSVSPTLLGIVAIVRLLAAVAISLTFAGRIRMRAARLFTFIGVGGMIGVMALYLVLLRMLIVSAGPVEWVFFLSSLAFQTIGTGGFGRWISEHVNS